MVTATPARPHNESAFYLPPDQGCNSVAHIRSVIGRFVPVNDVGAGWRIPNGLQRGAYGPCTPPALIRLGGYHNPDDPGGAAMTADHTPAPTPLPGSIEYGQRRDHAADDVERCRRIWHSSRAEVDVAKRHLMDAMRAEIMAAEMYRQAWEIYEAVR